ncbi:short-chain dehydrogenase reductase 3b-like isoform X1 [Diospyros lotus]|uniref:short-chain dehydrogenase reductase 3b-like isoform X1 n=2 Tax=Diospyros lotus TaxID=55363 RepID=UPI002258A659|nr:short-chain dehydrogenase reductase 3b-like isoform X1 [Diospyros lotus]
MIRKTMAYYIQQIQDLHFPVQSKPIKLQTKPSSMSKPRLEGKVALITGAASGIGEEAVRLFAANGACVVLADVQDELGRGVVESMASEKVAYRHCDVRDEKQVEETVKYAMEKFGKLDILFSNAGIIGPLTGILELDIEGLDNTMATNVRGVASTMKHAARAMVARQIRGSIICTTSVAASLGGAGPHAYTASKHALVGLVRAACSELGAYGIRVNCVSPFGVATPLSCKAYNLEPEEVEASSSAVANLKGVVLKASHVAEAALFLASDEAAYISGQNLGVDGGFTVVNHSYSAF